MKTKIVKINWYIWENLQEKDSHTIYRSYPTNGASVELHVPIALKVGWLGKKFVAEIDGNKIKLIAKSQSTPEIKLTEIIESLVKV